MKSKEEGQSPADKLALNRNEMKRVSSLKIPLSIASIMSAASPCDCGEPINNQVREDSSKQEFYDPSISILVI